MESALILEMLNKMSYHAGQIDVVIGSRIADESRSRGEKLTDSARSSMWLE
jgi:hypothetical protein